MTTPLPTVTDILADMTRDSADALIAIAVALLESMKLLSDIMEPLVGMRALSLNIETRRCARVYLLSSKRDLKQAQIIRGMKAGMDLEVLTSWQTLRLEELVAEFPGVEEVLLEVQEELTEVMATYDVGEE